MARRVSTTTMRAALIGAAVASLFVFASIANAQAAPTPAPPAAWEYRLTGGGATYGRLEARPSTSNSWGSVCDDGFDINDARVACRSLGLTPPLPQNLSFRTARSGEAGSTSDPIYFDDLECSGNELSLQTCARAAKHNCDHEEDIVLSCATSVYPNSYEYRLVGGVNNTYGRLEVRSPGASSWGTVCDDFFSANDALVACRSLGFAVSNATTDAAYRRGQPGECGANGQTVRMSDLTCDGTESELAHCSQASSFSCQHSEDIVVSCGVDFVPSLSWQVRLAGGTSNSNGIVEVKPDGYEWGTVCGSSFGTADAQVTCRGLGLPTDTVAYRIVALGETGPSDQQSHVTSVACAGTEASLDKCASQGTCSACDYRSAVMVSCGTDTIPKPDWQYRLVGGNASYGRLETRPSGLMPWGTVCDDNFGTDDAIVACRTLGLTMTPTVYRTATRTYDQGSGSIWMGNLFCANTEAKLHDCARSTFSCSHSEDVWLSCGSSSFPDTWEYRLVAGGLNYGRLEMRPNVNSAWGTACISGFGTSDATVACRALGMNTSVVGYRTVTTGEGAPTDYPTYMRSLSCGGTEARPDACSYSTSTTGCTHASSDVMLSCGISTPPLSWEYRLVAGSDDNNGRLEVRPHNDTVWGSVCDDAFGAVDASTACKSLGRNHTVVGYRKAEVGEATTWQPTWMDNLACLTSSSQLAACSRTSSPNCDPSESIMIACGNATVTKDRLHYRLADGNKTSTGRLEVRMGEKGAWSTVCATGWGASQTRTVCNALGLDSRLSAFRSANAGERATDAMPVYAHDFTCNGNNETSLQQCTAAQRADACSHDNDVIIACGESTVPTLWDYGLYAFITSSNVNGSTTIYGAPVARVGNYSDYQLLCDTNFGFNDAKVVCRAAGYSEAADANMVGFRSLNVPEEGTAYAMDDLACAGSEASPDVCTRSTSAPACGAGHGVLVSCGNTTVPSLYSYRLTGGNATYGRLEAKVANAAVADTYATICTVGFDANAAAAACRALNLNSSVVAFRIATAEERGSSAQRTTNFTGMACAADATAPDVCLTNTGASKCDHSTDVILACGHSTVPSIWQHRLVGGGANWGRVEVRPNAGAPWGTVCNDVFGTNDATTVCRALGLPTSPVYYNSAYNVGVAVGDSSQPTYIDNVACTGTESSIGECTFSKTEDCSHIEDIMVVCGGSAVPVAAEYRLVGGNPRVHGRLEMRLNSSAPFGTVCAEGFDSTDATVACRSLGLPTVRTAWRASNFGEGGATGQPIAMSNAACTSGATELAYCSYSATNGAIDTRCNRHDNDILLGCGVSAVPSSWEYRLVGGTETFGRLETRPNPTAAWGVVCPLGFGAKEAEIACKSLNLTHTSSAFRAGNSAGEFALASQPSWMENLGCIGTETALDQCPRAGAVTCNRESTVMLVCGATAFPQTYEYRLADATETHGRLEVRAAGTEPWGTVCSADANAARVACRALGLSTSAVGVRAAATNEQGAADQLVAMSGVTCSTGAESSFSACALTTPADAACGRAQDSAIACGVATVPSFWQYRLVGPDGTAATGNVGRLEARENSGLPWGMACDDMFTAATARVACASMGKPSNEASFRRATALERGRSDQPVTFDDLVCATGNETELSLCSRAAAGAINCGFEQAVVISCGTSALPESTAVWQYRLVGGSSEYGRLEARQSYTGTWGAVCGNTFAEADALVACRSLGFFGSNVSFRTAATSAEEGTRLQPTAIASLSCTGPETHLGQCAKAADPAAVSTCARSKDIVIACGTTDAPLPVRSTSAMAASGGSEWEYRLVGGSVSAGRLELRRRGDAVWGTACASGFDMNAAKAACAGLGFSGAQGFGQTYGENGNTVVHMDDLMCTGTEARLDYCGYRTEHNCHQWDSVRLDCAPTPLPSSPAQLAANLATPWAYRLSAGESFSSGRLEAMRPGESTWGSVCAVNFTKADAVVACRALGLPISPVSFRNASVAPSAMLTAARGSADLLPPLAEATAPIALEYLTCTGSEARPELCTRWTNTMPGPMTACDHSRDVVLTCGAERVPLSAGFRLSGSGWAAVLADAAQTATLRSNVAADVAEIAGVAPASLIKVTNMNVGSLIVNVSMLAASPAEADRFGVAFNGTEGQNLTESGAFGRVRTMYAANTPQGQAGEDVNVSAAVATPDPAAQAEPAPSRGGPPAEEDDGFSCEIGSDCSYVVLLVLVILVILCVIVAILLALKSNAAAAAASAGSASPADGGKAATTTAKQQDRGGVEVADDTNGDGSEMRNADPAVFVQPAGPPPARDARPEPVSE